MTKAAGTYESTTPGGRLQGQLTNLQQYADSAQRKALQIDEFDVTP